MPSEKSAIKIRHENTYRPTRNTLYSLIFFTKHISIYFNPFFPLGSKKEELFNNIISNV